MCLEQPDPATASGGGASGDAPAQPHALMPDLRRSCCVRVLASCSRESNCRTATAHMLGRPLRKLRRAATLCSRWLQRLWAGTARAATCPRKILAWMTATQLHLCCSSGLMPRGFMPARYMARACRLCLITHTPCQPGPGAATGRRKPPTDACQLTCMPAHAPFLGLPSARTFTGGRACLHSCFAWL